MGIFADIFILPDIRAASRRAQAEMARRRQARRDQELLDLRRREVEAMEKLLHKALDDHFAETGK